MLVMSEMSEMSVVLGGEIFLQFVVGEVDTRKSRNFFFPTDIANNFRHEYQGLDWTGLDWTGVECSGGPFAPL